jgi:ATP-dependent helicase/nuclease subunit A
MHKLREYAGILARSELDGDLQVAARLEAAFAATDNGARFDLIVATLLTREGTLRRRKESKEANKRFGAAAVARLIELHVQLGERVLAARDARREEQAYELNLHAFTAGAAWMDALEQYKRERRLVDFADLEWHVARMLADEARAAFLQARLDARYKHVLLDEFQDTNPLQWQILLAWLAAYGAPDAARPRVFVVGDPKQSIYRFRRAEPRVFDCAADFLQADYGAQLLANDTTRRNAPRLIEVVNRVFAGEPQFPHFRPHRSLKKPCPAGLLLPCAHGKWRRRPPLRDPLAAADCGRTAAARRRCAAAGIVGRWAVIDEHRRGIPA